MQSDFFKLFISVQVLQQLFFCPNQPEKNIFPPVAGLFFTKKSHIAITKQLFFPVSINTTIIWNAKLSENIITHF